MRLLADHRDEEGGEPESLADEPESLVNEPESLANELKSLANALHDEEGGELLHHKVDEPRHNLGTISAQSRHNLGTISPS